MDYRTPQRRPLEICEGYFLRNLNSDEAPCGMTKNVKGWSELTDAPSRVHNHEHSNSTLIHVSNDSPGVELLLQKLLIDKEDESTVSNADRKLILTLSPRKTRTKRQRESVEADVDDNAISGEEVRRVQNPPFTK